MLHPNKNLFCFFLTNGTFLVRWNIFFSGHPIPPSANPGARARSTFILFLLRNGVALAMLTADVEMAKKMQTVEKTLNGKKMSDKEIGAFMDD